MILVMGVGIFVGILLGFGWKYSFFYIVIFVLVGGIGEGIFFLFFGYSVIIGLLSE